MDHDAAMPEALAARTVQQLPDPAPSPDFVCGARELAEALTRMADEDAVSLPLLGAEDCQALVEAARPLPFRRARPIIGEGADAVYQDFELNYDLPSGGPFHAVARGLERLLAEALHLAPRPLLAAPPPLNDLIVQRYAAGSRGITPHRDHIRYEDLVIIVPLSGSARFYLCAARDGRSAREIPAPVGSAVIMRAPGFAGSRARPFHYVTEIAAERLSFGLRHDVRDAPPPA
jgi:hypothetical protein